MRKKKLELSSKDFNVDNPTPRIPVVICLDVSSSMMGEPIQELNKGLKLFYDAIYASDDARYAAEICIVTFGDVVEVVSPFNLVSKKTEVRLKANGKTLIGTAINKALELLETRKKTYKLTGTPYYQPWLIVMTDGCSYGESLDLLHSSIKKCNKLENDSRIVVFPIGIGHSADYLMLNKFSTRHRAFKINNLKFEEFFEWLSQSISVVSSSQTGDTINIPTAAISTWGGL